MIPYFYGGSGKMEIRYGVSKTLTVKDKNGRILADRHITLTTPEDYHVQTLQTDGSGRVSFDLPTVRHFKIGNSQEHNGITGAPSRTDYQQFVFTLTGYKPFTVSIAQLRDADTLMLEGS